MSWALERRRPWFCHWRVIGCWYPPWRTDEIGSGRPSGEGMGGGGMKEGKEGERVQEGMMGGRREGRACLDETGGGAKGGEWE